MKSDTKPLSDLTARELDVRVARARGINFEIRHGDVYDVRIARWYSPVSNLSACAELLDEMAGAGSINLSIDETGAIFEIGKHEWESDRTMVFNVRLTSQADGKPSVALRRAICEAYVTWKESLITNDNG